MIQLRCSNQCSESSDYVLPVEFPFEITEAFVLVLQNGDIIAPGLTPLKPGWNNNNEGEEEDAGAGTAAANGPSGPKKKLF